MAPQADGAAGDPSPPVDESASHRDADVLRLYSYLWAAAVFFHIGSFDLWSETRLEVVAANWVLFRPGSTLAMTSLMTLYLHATLPVTWRTANHALFGSAVAVAWLLSLLLLSIKNRRFRVDRGELFRTFAPPVRWSLITLYFFASFHKFNSDWFDPAVSCGAMLYARERDVFPFLPASPMLSLLSIYASLGFEIAIPILLAFRSTRYLGILTGMVFHWILATNPESGFYNFSSMLFALFALFLSPQLVTHAGDWIGRNRLNWLSRSVSAIVAGYTLVGYPFFSAVVPSSRDAARLAWFVYGSGLISLFALLSAREKNASAEAVSAFRLPQPMLAIVPLLVFLNGAAPYLGLHTTATWAMYSNLRTEAGRSNHLLIPASVQLFGYQRDVVQVHRSSDAYLHKERRRYIPYFELRRRPEASVTYFRSGVEYRFARIADDPRFHPAPRLAAAFMVFRPMDRRPKQACVH